MKLSLIGTSLVEALVASVVFLTIFLIAMDSLTNIARIRLSDVSPKAVEMAIGECLVKFSEGTDYKAAYSYPWGDIELRAEPYRDVDNMLDVTVTAKSKNEHTVIYRYLIWRH